MLSDTLERVRNYWKREGLFSEYPLDRLQIEDRLTSIGVRGTEEIVAVVSTLNGFKVDEMDDEGFSFWSIDQMVEENLKGEWVKDKRYVHFADFLIFSHTYCFRQVGSPSTSIYCHWSLDDIVKIANSFEEFFEYYHMRDRRLWPV